MLGLVTLAYADSIDFIGKVDIVAVHFVRIDANNATYER